MTDLPHLRLFEPAPGILAWYDGRVPGYRMYEGPNWVDDGAIELGIAAYALVEGAEALVYDAQVSVTHALRMRADLEARGVTRFTTVLSHRHLDHIAGTGSFADWPVISCTRTAEAMAANREAIEDGSYGGPPGIKPLVLPSKTFADRLALTLGPRRVELIRFDIHSDDGVVAWLPQTRTLLAGDTLEDPITYVAEPAGLARHLAELDRLAALKPEKILPNHGDPETIAKGGFGPGLIDATRRYVGWLLELKAHPEAKDTPLRDLLGVDIQAGNVVWYPAYEAVHAGNVAEVLALG